MGKSSKQVAREKAQNQKAMKETAGRIEQNTQATKQKLFELNQITTEIGETNSKLNKLNGEIEGLDRRLTNINDSITQMNSKLLQMRDSYARAVRKMHAHRGTSLKQQMLFLFSSKSFSQALRRLRYLRQFSLWRQRKMQQITQAQDELNTKRNRQEQTLNTKRVTATAIESSRQELEQRKAKEAVVVAQLQKDGANLQRVMSEQQRKAAKLEAQLDLIIRKEEEQRIAQEKARAAQEAERVRRLEAEKRRKAEAEAARLRQIEEEKRLRAEAEARARAIAQEKAQAEAEARKRAQEAAEQARLAQEAKRRAEEAEAAQRRAITEEAKRKAAIEAGARRKAAVEAEKARIKAEREAEAERKKAEKAAIEAKKKSEKEQKRRLAEEKRLREEAQRRAEEDARREKENQASAPAPAPALESVSRSGATERFEASKGRLLTPVTGSYKVISTFGLHSHPDLKYIKTNNGGIDILTSNGANARAVCDGKVSAVFRTDGFNTTVMVRHGSYITIYVNLQNALVTQGQTVKAGQALGKIYTDREDGNRTILHFEVRKDRDKLDPQQWIGR